MSLNSFFLLLFFMLNIPIICLVHRSLCQSISRSAGQLVRRSVGQSVSWSVDLLVSRSAGKSVSWSAGQLRVGSTQSLTYVLRSSFGKSVYLSVCLAVCLEKSLSLNLNDELEKWSRLVSYYYFFLQGYLVSCSIDLLGTDIYSQVDLQIYIVR